MTIATEIRRPLGTMIVHGFPGLDLGVDLDIARRIGAEVVEILPDWRSLPDPAEVRDRAGGLGLKVHSAHGCWGGRTIRAARVDLGHLDPAIRSEGVDDLRRCVDWLRSAGGSCLVVHPGGFSAPEDTESRSEALADSLAELADHAAGSGMTLCVENMPPGVHPGSRMADLADLVAKVARPEVALALDTGHAHLGPGEAAETENAGSRLRTTHVHDNDGRSDTHLPPGLGSIDWGRWVGSLDAIGYRGPIVLECIRHLRQSPACIDETFLTRLRRLTGLER